MPFPSHVISNHRDNNFHFCITGTTAFGYRFVNFPERIDVRKLAPSCFRSNILWIFNGIDPSERRSRFPHRAEGAEHLNHARPHIIWQPSDYDELSGQQLYEVLGRSENHVCSKSLADVPVGRMRTDRRPRRRDSDQQFTHRVDQVMCQSETAREREPGASPSAMDLRRAKTETVQLLDGLHLIDGSGTESGNP